MSKTLSRKPSTHPCKVSSFYRVVGGQLYSITTTVDIS